MKSITSHFFIALFIVSSFNVFSQDTQSSEAHYSSYFQLPRESIFLHLNKTTFTTDDKIWFKGYVYDRWNDLPSNGTTNIYVGLYDSEGKQIDKKLYYTEKGITEGSIALNPELTQGTYYVKASTNWMRNFKESDAFVQAVTILNPKNSIDITKPEDNEDFDFQFLPEGGHLIVETTNVIGFKSTDSHGNGVKATGSIVDDAGNAVVTFKSGSFGMGKFLFLPERGKTYTANIRSEDDSEHQKKLPVAKREGVSIMVNNTHKDRLLITLNTNAQTLANNVMEDYKLLIHKNGKIKSIPIAFAGLAKKEISVSKDGLFPGINIITLFNAQEQPVLERLFYNDKGIKTNTINVVSKGATKDSLQFEVRLGRPNAKPTNISISVLPETTLANNPDHNMYSYFYLRPYVNGKIEDAGYYFLNSDRRKKYELDILLITQGWSRYRWDNIFGNKPKMTNKFETGIAINGRVNKPATKIDSVYMYATKYHPSQFIALDGDNSFKMANLFIDEDEVLRFSYLNKENQFLRPSLSLNFDVFNSEDHIDKDLLVHRPALSFDNMNIGKSANDPVKLDEVLLETTKTIEAPEESLGFKNNTTEISTDVASLYPNILDYIETNGYNVTQNFGRIEIQTRNALSIGFGGPTHPSPIVYLNDVVINDLSILYNFQTDAVKKITIDKSGIGQGVRGAGGTIKIYTKDKVLVSDYSGSGGGGPNKSFEAKPVAIGFASAKEQYTPKYLAYDTSFFKYLGDIDWIPNMTIDTTSATFTIKNTNTEAITFYIEGMSADGTLCTTVKTITASQQ
ncbi:hypothetical protein [Winogradskyella sp. 3972H.M.0a.05]|uniref:hypothetical protein n=1 Tax=Winogradskyella sp. 3972H.M.0a.05 TaxID=2950277 RepID=UPI00339881DC